MIDPGECYSLRRGIPKVVITRKDRAQTESVPFNGIMKQVMILPFYIIKNQEVRMVLRVYERLRLFEYIKKQNPHEF